MGFFRDNTGKENAAKRAERDMRLRSIEAGEGLYAARRESRDILNPMAQAGNQAISDIQGLGPGPESTINPFFFTQFASSGLADDVDVLGRRQFRGGLGQALSADTGLDPNVLNSPFFQALQEESTRNLERSAAARGRVGAGGTADAIARQSMLLGADFAQRDLDNRLGVQGTRFNQLMDRSGRLLDMQQQRFNQQTGLAGVRSGLNAQDATMFGGAAMDMFNQNLMGRQQRANELGGLANIGSGALTNQANIVNNVAGQRADLLTGIGNAQAASHIAQGNIGSGLQSIMGGGLGQLGMMGLMAANPALGIGAGLSNLFGGGAQTPPPSFSFGGDLSYNPNLY